MVDFRAVIDNLDHIGLYSVFLPFILTYVVVFAILEKSEIFSKKENKDVKQTKNVNAIIAFVFGLFVVASVQTVRFIQDLIMNIVVFIVFILVLLILLGFIYGDEYKKLLDNKFVKWGIASIVLLISIIILFNVIGLWEYLEDFNLGDSETWFTILIFGGIFGLLYWITKTDSKES